VLQAYVAGAAPLDLLKREETRIMDEIVEIKRRTEVDRSKLVSAKQLADTAMTFLANCHAAYIAAKGGIRRNWNRALFNAIYVAHGQVARLEYADPFPGLLAWAGSNNEHLVSPPGFEPGTKGLKVPCSSVELRAREHQV
jgi:site-specific DNA recombinase